MSSEQWYDYSYEQFINDDLPNLNLFGESFTTPTTYTSSHDLQENCPADSQQVEQSLFNDKDVPEQSQQFQMIDDAAGNYGFHLSGITQHSVSSTCAPMDLVANFEDSAQWDLSAGDFRSQEDEFQTVDYFVGLSQMGRSQAAQPSPWSSYGSPSLPDPVNPKIDVAERAHLLQIEPIGCLEGSTLPSMSELTPRVNIDIVWSGPRKCHWQNCTSKATFHSPSSLKTHINNIHVNPLICIHPDCSYKKPFGKPCDLERHVRTIHGTECEYPCPESDCQERFSRKDKMMKHAKEKHELFKCSCNHCSATVFAVQRELHLTDSHGRFECAMGSCKFGKMSYFTEKTLTRHMRTCHGMDYWQATSSLQMAKYDETLRVDTELSSTYRDCASCLSQSHNEQ